MAVGIVGGVGAERAGILIGLLIPAELELSLRPGERLGLARAIEVDGRSRFAPGGKGMELPAGSVVDCITMDCPCLDGITGGALTG